MQINKPKELWTDLKSRLSTHFNWIKDSLFFLIAVEILIISFVSLRFVLIQANTGKDILGHILNLAIAVGTLLLFGVTYEYVLLTRALVKETRKAREAQEKPFIAFRIIPEENSNLLQYSIKNSGAGSAFDIQLSFDPDLDENFVGKIPRNISYLGPKEEIRFFFANAPDYFENLSSVKQFNVSIKYSKYPKSEKTKCGNGYYEPPIEYPVNVEELKDVNFLDRKNVHDIANGLIGLKDGIFLIGQKLNDLEEQHLKSKKRI